MLRNVVLALGAALLAFGVMGAFAGHLQAALFMIVWGAILMFGILYERYGYKNIVEAVPTGTGWVRTPERFVDEKSGRTVTVYTKPLTGERVYVAETFANPAAPPPPLEG